MADDFKFKRIKQTWPPRDLFLLVRLKAMMTCARLVTVTVLLYARGLVRAAVILHPSFRERGTIRVPDTELRGDWKLDDLKNGFTSTEKEAILEKHNGLRRGVMATNMNRLVSAFRRLP